MALRILEKHQDKIIWCELSRNPNIFTLDYDWLKKRMDILREELMVKVWHPSRIARYLEQGMDLEDL